jgi:hypothetical protein
MSFLWNAMMQMLTILKSPSPKHRKHFVPGDSIERASLFGSLRKVLPASMTVEASIVLPLFLFFFINLGSAMEMMRLHGNLQLALWNVGNQICVYGYALDSSDTIRQAVSQETEKQWWRELSDIAISYSYIKGSVVDYLGESYLNASPLRYGTSGLQFWESKIVQGDVAEIVMTYQVAPWMDIPFVQPFRMSNHYYGHLWTGYDLGTLTTDEENGQDVVYVTANGSVYHETPDCTHLKLTIRAVPLVEARKARNDNGVRYEECAKCRGKLLQGAVYIAREGDCYHYDRSCSGLKRTIYTIPRTQAADYRPCSRCAK